MNNTQNPSAIKSKIKITEALLKLMNEYTYQDITVKQIILETDLVRKTFYRNFSSKDDVLDSIITDKINEYVNEIVTSPDSPIKVVFKFCEKNKPFLLLLHKNGLLPLLLLKLNQIIPKSHMVTDRSVNPYAAIIGELEPDYLVAFNVGAIWNVIFKWVDRGMTDSAEKIETLIETYLSRMAPLSN